MVRVDVLSQDGISSMTIGAGTGCMSWAAAACVYASAAHRRLQHCDVMAVQRRRSLQRKRLFS